MRLFTGIPIGEEVKANLGRLITHLRPTAQLQWSPNYNLHITTKFIGEWPKERVEELAGALRPLQKRAPFDVQVRDLGWFPNPHSPRVFWAAVHSGPELAQLASDIEGACKTIGIPAEDRKFTPHLTLARVRRDVPLGPLRRAIAELKTTEFGAFHVGAFHLYLSEPGPAGSIYTSLAEFPLSAE